MRSTFLVVFTAAALSLCVNASAAEPGKFDLSHLEVSAWWAPNPKMAVDYYKTNPLYYTYYLRGYGRADNERLQSMYSDYSDDVRSAGVFGLQASYSIKRRLDISLAAGMVVMGHTNYDGITDAVTGSYSKAVFSLCPEIRFKYVDRQWLRMYSAFSYGFQIAPTFDDPITQIYQLSVLGLSIGRAVRVFGEVGVGCVYNGLKFGAAYKF